ncbi:MAG: 30S ribosomal protein S20 [Eubacteriales bacterium]
MANIKSAKKRVLINRSKALRNKALKTRLKTIVKKFDTAVASGVKEDAVAAYTLAVKRIDQAVGHGILHKNAAARKKSQITLKLNHMA